MAPPPINPPTGNYIEEYREIVEHQLAELDISFKKRNEAPATLSISDLGPLETAIIYDSGLSFEIMDKGYLCNISRYFSNALNGPFKEATTRIIRLRHDFPWAVYAMLDFLKNGSYYMYPVLLQQYPRITMLDLHVHCYIVADKYDLPALANYAGANCLRIVADALMLDWKFDDPDFYDESESLPCVNYHPYDMCAEAEVSRFLDSVVLLWRNTASSNDALRKEVVDMIKACFIKLMRLKSFQFVFSNLRDFRLDLEKSFGENGLVIMYRARKENGYKVAFEA
ncbi:hypothetical protein SLS60_004422 [Paraconiothyrium brasiliense]|uniref:BTB domain-containing protein n=1 Tax=Paraconiothyrium brasiliense TaxID=300254 RepID=A0ABR3RKH4_9PLEO